MADDDIIQRIDKLVDEEHELRQGGPVDSERLQQVEEMLDQCWDLLRQRRARREFGEDPSAARPRPTGMVEDYEQ